MGHGNICGHYVGLLKRIYQKIAGVSNFIPVEKDIIEMRKTQHIHHKLKNSIPKTSACFFDFYIASQTTI